MGATWAEAMSALVARSGHTGTGSDRVVFPTDDSLPLLLQSWQANADVLMLVITKESKTAGERLSALCRGEPRPQLLLCLAPGAPFPSSCQPTDPQLLLPGDDPVSRIIWLRTRSRLPDLWPDIAQHAFPAMPPLWCGLASSVAKGITVACRTATRCSPELGPLPTRSHHPAPDSARSPP